MPSMDPKTASHGFLSEAAPAAGQLGDGLRDPVALFIKRILDLTVAVLLLLPAIPFAAAIALAIVLDSRGPVFFAHTRIGKGNRQFRLWKFRTMVRDADTVLEQHLKAHPDLRAEWLETHKLKNDPRVTRVGRLLRRSSLDELPQLISVLRGEMSMVGPRPIVADEVPSTVRCSTFICKCGRDLPVCGSHLAAPIPATVRGLRWTSATCRNAPCG